MDSINRYPGKFEGARSKLLATVLYERTMLGCDEEAGEAEFGWWGLIRGKRYGFIVHEDTNGFFSYNYWPLSEAEVAWQELVEDYQLCEEDQEQEEEGE